MAKVAEFFKGMIQQTVFYRCVLTSTVFSFILTSVIAIFMGDLRIQISSPFYEYKANNGHWFVISFITFTCFLSILGYFSEYKGKEDILTPIRKMLVGTWKVSFESWMIDGETVRKSKTQDVCVINIDKVSAKLYMNFNILDSDIFRNTEFDISNINIQFQTEPKKLIYFHEIDLELIDPAFFKREEAKVVMPILGVVDFRIVDDKVDLMSGYWYDVNNTVWHLIGKTALSGSDAINDALMNGTITFKGSVRFDRVLSGE